MKTSTCCSTSSKKRGSSVRAVSSTSRSRCAKSNDIGLPFVPEEIKEARFRRFMERQQKISAEILKRKIGKRLPVIIDQANGTYATGPHQI